MKGQPSERHGFSLIELIVVIAIIAILAAILLPSLSRAKARQQRVHCVGNLHQFGIALQSFLSNNHGYPQYVESRYSGWYHQLEVEGFGISKPPRGFMETGVWRCPAAQWPANFSGARFSYGYNAFGCLRIGDRINSPGLHGHYDPTKNIRSGVVESEVVAPADMIAIGESCHFAFMRSQQYDFFKLPVRHQGKVDILLCDSHVESTPTQTLFENTSDEALSRWNRDHTPHREGL